MNDNSVDLFYALKLPPEKAIEYFRSKGYKISWSWRDVWNEAHTKAFTVAKAMKLDILQDIREELQKALDDGITFQQFLKELKPRLQSKGWWGWMRADEVPGYDSNSAIPPDKMVLAGSLRRLKTIYQTNLQTSYMAGRYKAMIENVEDRPYWMYIQIDRKTKRIKHSKLHGKVFLWNDPIWDIIYPPNGFGCACRVRALTKAQFEAMGIKLSKGEDFNAEDFIEPGWNYNPGKAWLFDKNGNLPACAEGVQFEQADNKNCIKIVGAKTYKDFGRPDIRNLPPEYFQPAPAYLVKGKDKAEALKILSASLGITEENKTVTIKTPIEEVIIKEDYLSHIIEKRSDARERFGSFILPTLKNPFEIYNTQFEDSWRLQYIGLFTGKYNILSSVRINKDGSFLYNFMQANDKAMNNHRKGILIWYK